MEKDTEKEEEESVEEKVNCSNCRKTLALSAGDTALQTREGWYLCFVCYKQQEKEEKEGGQRRRNFFEQEVKCYDCGKLVSSKESIQEDVGNSIFSKAWVCFKCHKKRRKSAFIGIIFFFLIVGGIIWLVYKYYVR